MQCKFLAAFALAFLFMPTAAGSGPADAAERLLAQPANDVKIAFATSNPPLGQIQDALDHGAYRWALSLMAESVARHRTSEIWNSSKNSPEPYAAYSSGLAEWASSEIEGLGDVNEQLLAAEQRSRRTTLDVEHLLFAAQYSAMAETSLLLGSRLIVTVADAPESHDSPQKRYLLAYPIAQGTVFNSMAQKILAHYEPHPGRLLPSDELAAAIDQQGGAGTQWIVAESGIIHRLARHLSVYEIGLLESGASVAEVQAQIDQLLSASLDLVRERGFSGARPRAAAQDASWWLAQDDSGNPALSTGQADMLNRMSASLKLAQYEADLLTAVGGERDDKHLPVWLLPVMGLVLAVSVGAGFFLFRRRQGEKPPMRMLPLVVFAISAALFAWPAAEARPAPAEPLSEPTLVAADGVVSWGGSILPMEDGVVHLAWGECLDQGAACPVGRLAIRYRTFDSSTNVFSQAATLISLPGVDAYSPQLLADQNGLTMFWQQGLQAWSRGQTTTHPTEIWWCRITEQVCSTAQRISQPKAGVESFEAVAGTDGALRIAWAELGPLGLGEVVYRQHSASGWGPEVRFPDGGSDQWQPALAVEGSGLAQVAWHGRPLGAPSSAHLIHHATVASDATTGGSSQAISNHLVGNEGLALAIRTEETHLVYGNSDGLYHQVRRGGEWTDAVLVSPTGETTAEGQPLRRPTQRPDLVQTATGVSAVWMERVPPAPGMRLRMAELNAGMWLRPTTVLEPPQQALFNPVLATDAKGLLHLGWSGNTPPGESIGRFHYMTVALGTGLADAGAPQTTVLAPLDKSWTRQTTINLSVEVSLDAPMDAATTQWTVDGNHLQFSASSNRLTSTFTQVTESIHNVELTVGDTAGNRQVTRWSFGVDRTAPALQWKAVDANGSLAKDWMSSPVLVTATSPPDQGAPTIVELQAVDARGEIVPLGSGRAWTPVPNEGLQIPANILVEVTARARDAAGNVALGQPLFLGWDSSVPLVNVSAPAPWHRGQVGVDLELLETKGSPVRVDGLLVRQDGTGSPQEAVIEHLTGRTRLTYPAVSDGHYTLTVTAVDRSHNAASLAGPWTIGVDTAPPLLAVSQSGGTTHLVAQDAGSGVGRLVVTKGSQSLGEQTSTGNPSLELAITEAAVGSKVVATDTAGNELRAILRGGGQFTVETIPTTAGEDARGEARWTPSLTPALTVLGIGLLALRRRERH